MSASASPPSIPCDYECLWPIGTYDIPEAAVAGEDYVITYTYAWQEIPGDSRIGTLDQKEIPPGRHADSNPGAASMPPGYGGSTVWLQLPDGIDVVSWSAGKLEKRALWVDHFGRTTYEYLGLNRHVAEGPATASITIRVRPGASIYLNDEIRVNLGVRGDSWRSPALFANMDGDIVRFSSEPARGVAGATYAASALRGTHVLPGSAVTPLGKVDLVGAAAQSVRSFSLGQVGVGGDFAYAYGYLLAQDRPPDMVGAGANMQVFSGATGVRACAHDTESQGGEVRTEPIMVNGEPACSTVGADGFFGIVVPRSDPDGDGTPADIVPVFSLDHERVTVRVFGGGPISTRGLEPASAGGDTVPLGRYTVPGNALFTTAWWMYSDALDAHRFFSSVLGHDAPHVDAIRHNSAFYDLRDGSINLVIEPRGSAQGHLSSSRTTVLHEYAHHVMGSVYDAGIPPQGICGSHRPGKITNAVCAWTEGWAEFVAIAIDDNPLRRFGLTTKSSHFDYEAREIHTRPQTGEYDPLSGSLRLTLFRDGSADEGNITASLWDLHDHGSTEPGDNMSGGLPDIWSAFTSPPASGETFNAATIHDFWLDWIEQGHADPGDVFSLNKIPDALSVTSRLNAHVERDGAQKTGIGAGYARAGDTIVARLEANGRISASSAPEVAILGGGLVAMTLDSTGAWVARADVGQEAHDGKIPITVRANAPRIKMADDAVSHENGSDTVTIRTAYEPVGGTHKVVADPAVTDSDGTSMASATSREFVHDPGLPALVTVVLSPDGREVVLYFTKGVDGSTVTLENIRLDSRLTPAVDPISHEDGSSVVRVRLSSPPPADGTYSVSVSSIADTQGRRLGATYIGEPTWNPRPPVLESVKLSDDRRRVTLMFDEEVNRHLGNFIVFMYDSEFNEIGEGPFITSHTSASHTFSLHSPLEPGSYNIIVRNAADALGHRIPIQEKVLTYTDGRAPILNTVSADPGGHSITLVFDREVSSAQLANHNIMIIRRFLPPPSFDAIDIPDMGISHTDRSNTITVTLDEKLKDGTYEVVWSRKDRSIGAFEIYENTQRRYFWWNPETPRLESYVVAPDGRSVNFTFSEEMLEERFETNVLSGGTTAIDRANAATKKAGSSTITLNLAAPLQKGLHRITLQPFMTDVGGLRMATEYTTVFQWDGAPPSLESAEVSANGESIRLTFSEGLDGSTVTAASIVPGASLTPDADNPIEHTDGSNTVTLNLASEPASGQHEVTARGTIADSTGVSMGTDRTLAFAHVPGAPVFEAASISADGRTVTLEFSEGLDGSTVTPASVHFVTTDEHLLFAQDADGTPIAVDTTPPRLLDAFFTSASRIRLELSEPPDPAMTTATAFALESRSSTVPFTVTPHTPGEAAVTLSLGSDAPNADHVVSVRAMLTDRAGNPVVESSKTINPQDAAGEAPRFTARLANDVMVIVEFSEAVRVKQGAELGLRDWLSGSLRPANHHVDLDNRRIVLQFDMAGVPGLGLGDISYKPVSGESALEDHTGYDIPVGSSASTSTAPRNFPFFFAERVEEGVINMRFDRTVSETPSEFRIGGTTAASEWTVNGVPATGVRAGATGEASSSIALSSDPGFYLTHSAVGASETLQVKYTRPTSGGNTLSNTAGALETMQVTSVNRIRNAFTAGEFADARTLELTSTRPADRRVADHLTIAATGDAPPVTLASGSRSPTNPLVEVLRLGTDARDGCTYRVSLMDAVSSAMGIWTPAGGGQGEVTYADTHAPVFLSASTDGTTTRVLFNEPVAFGAAPTIGQHRAHWTVTDAGAARQIAAVAVSATDPSTVEITHAALSGTAATPTVAYDGTADDDARIRDTRASPCTDTDATPKNAQGGTLRVVAFDGIAPGASSVSAAVSGDGGAAKSGPNAIWAGIGDTVTVSLAMDEDGHETAAPRLFAAGSNVGMAMGETARLWSGGVSIGASTSEGALGYTITAPDAAGNLGVFADAGGAEPIARVDTTLPQVASAETTGAGGARVTLSEGAWGLLRASDWTVGGERASGASLGAGGEPSPAVALAGEASFTLHVPGAVGTGATPRVVYSPQAPGAAPDPAGPDAGPAPPQAGITLDVGGLDGATVRLGESREFPITAAADDAQPIVLLEGNPDFVAVENTGPGTATVTVDASHESAAAGDYTFAVVAATGSGPARAEVTVTLEPAA